MQAVAGLGKVSVALGTMLSTLFWAIASAVGPPTASIPTLAVPLPTSVSPSEETTPTSSSSHGTSSRSTTSSSQFSGTSTVTRCRGCVLPVTSSTERLFPSSMDSHAASEEDVPVPSDHKTAPPAATAPIERAITVPGFGLVVVVAALIVMFRRR